MTEKYIETLENAIKQMLQPLRNIPLKLVIESLSGYKIVPFNPKDPQDQAVLNTLIKVAELAGSNVNKEGILRHRPNEVGNDIESFVLDALRTFEYESDKPITVSGKKKSTGYPDIEFKDEFNRINYLECKTYNAQSISTTMRAFYLSPSENFKVTKDAHHFVISYEIYVDGQVKMDNIYKCRNWKILSLDQLLVDVKYEFNCDNRRLYSKELILAEGTL